MRGRISYLFDRSSASPLLMGGFLFFGVFAIRFLTLLFADKMPFGLKQSDFIAGLYLPSAFLVFLAYYPSFLSLAGVLLGKLVFMRFYLNESIAVDVALSSSSAIALYCTMVIHHELQVDGKKIRFWHASVGNLCFVSGLYAFWNLIISYYVLLIFQLSVSYEFLENFKAMLIFFFGDFLGALLPLIIFRIILRIANFSKIQKENKT